jgi:hypothetical protein
MIVSMHAPNIGALKFIKQTLVNIKDQIGQDTIIVGDLSTALSSVGRTSDKKINRDILD